MNIDEMNEKFQIHYCYNINYKIGLNCLDVHNLSQLLRKKNLTYKIIVFKLLIHKQTKIHRLKKAKLIFSTKSRS